MLKNRIIFVLYLAVLSWCMAYAQTSGRWINYYEDGKGIYSYRSDIKIDRDNNHYIWIKCNITSPKERLEWTNTLKSNVPINCLQARIVFDSDFELMKPFQFMVLSKQGKVLADFKSEMFFEWMELGKDQFVALKNRLGNNSSLIYDNRNERTNKVYPETNKQSSKVYNDLLGIIKEKQRKQKEETPKQSQFEDDDRIDPDVDNNYSPAETIKKETPTKEEEGIKVFDVVEEMPQFSGGPQALFDYLSKSIKYPVETEENGAQGRVIVSFIVERDGSITDVKVVKSVDPSLDQEAIRVVKAMPHWIPGKQNGSTVRVKYTVPVTFRLQ